jgi:hypothetical protein
MRQNPLPKQEKFAQKWLCSQPGRESKALKEERILKKI